MKKTLCVFLILLSSCSTGSIKERTLNNMGIAAVAGGVIGAVTVPEGDKTIPHVALWAGITAAVAGAASLLIYDEDKLSKEREKQIEALHNEVAALRGETPYSLDKKEVFRTQSTLEKEIPAQYRNLVKPGEWSIYEIDQWVDSGDHMKIHQDKIFKLEPPQMNVGSK